MLANVLGEGVEFLAFHERPTSINGAKWTVNCGPVKEGSIGIRDSTEKKKSVVSYELIFPVASHTLSPTNRKFVLVEKDCQWRPGEPDY